METQSGHQISFHDKTHRRKRILQTGPRRNTDIEVDDGEAEFQPDQRTEHQRQTRMETPAIRGMKIFIAVQPVLNAIAVAN